MAVLSELRYPTTRLAKFLSGIFAIALFLFVSIAALSGFLLYQVLHPSREPATIDLSVMMGHPDRRIRSQSNGAGSRRVVFPGLRGAPTIVVCHGYHSQRSDVLTLVTALQEQQFNVFLFDFMAHGTSPGVTTLGYRETAELQAAIGAPGDTRRCGPEAFRTVGHGHGRVRGAREVRSRTRAWRVHGGRRLCRPARHGADRNPALRADGAAGRQQVCELASVSSIINFATRRPLRHGSFAPREFPSCSSCRTIVQRLQMTR